MVWRLGRPLPGSVEEAAKKIELLLDLEEAEKRRRPAGTSQARTMKLMRPAYTSSPDFSARSPEPLPAGRNAPMPAATHQTVAWAPWTAGVAEIVGDGSPLKGDAGGYERQRDEDCERLYEEDSKICRSVRTRACWASAAERLAACLKGSEIPELDTESRWMVPGPFEFPRTPRPVLPLPLPFPGGGGGGAPIPIWRLKSRDPRT